MERHQPNYGLKSFFLNTWYLLGWWCLRNHCVDIGVIPGVPKFVILEASSPPFFFSSNGYQLKGKRVITLPQQSLMMLVITVDRSEIPGSPVEVDSLSTIILRWYSIHGWAWRWGTSWTSAFPSGEYPTHPFWIWIYIESSTEIFLSISHQNRWMQYIPQMSGRLLLCSDCVFVMSSQAVCAIREETWFASPSARTESEDDEDL